MNSNPTSLSRKQDSHPNSPVQKLRSLVRRNLVGTIAATVAGSLLLTAVSAGNIWSIYNSFQSTVAKQFKLQKLSDDQVYQDEYFTMTTKMLVTSGDLQWEERYKKMLPTAEATTKEFLANITTELQAEAKKTDAAANVLFATEDKVLKLVREGKKEAAAQLLDSEEYTNSKKTFGDGNKVVLDKVDKLIKTELNNYQQQLSLSIAFAATSLPVLLAAWMFVIAAVRDYIRDRVEAQKAIEQSQTETLQLNEKLAGEVEVRSQQEQKIRQESEQLQADIGHILDVVCSLEEGDLTVQAEVNERATGLVSDTLNRLSESLDRIVSAAVNTAKQVTNDAKDLELVAIETSHQAQVQTAEVGAVQSLMDNINTLTADSRQQAIDTAVAVRQAKAAALSGKEAIEHTTKGIETLQQGTDQIVRRAQLLNEFLELAAQFSKDRKRDAALTRVLALNVSTLSSRAASERDPEQFATLAREFETIAAQVNNLAVDNERSLVSLQQRTDSVQTVTSGLAQDISEIEQLVQKFTGEVNKSRTAFDNIQTVTEEVDRMSKQVNRSSQDIVQVVTETLAAIQSISTIAQTTAAKASLTKEQAQSMGDLANKLLEMVEFFKLSESQLAKIEQKQLVQV